MARALCSRLNLLVEPSNEECGMSQHVDEAAIAAEEERRSKVAAMQRAYDEVLEAARVKGGAHKAAMQRAYDDALVVQSACNLSGVVFSFARHMETICEECRDKGTHTRNTHPVVRLFVTQLMWLAFHQTVDDHDLYSKAHQECVKNASPRVLAMLGITQQPELQPEEVPSSAVEEAVQ